MSFATILHMERDNGAISTFSDHPLIPYIQFTNDESCFTNDRPSLIVGYKNALRLFPAIDILEHTVPGQRLARWCFSPVESGLGFLREFRDQLERIPGLLLKSVTKSLISPLTETNGITTSVELAKVLEAHSLTTAYRRNRVWHLITEDAKVLIIPVGLYSDSFKVRDEGFTTYLKKHCSVVVDDDALEGKVHRFFIRELDWHHDQLDLIIARALSFEVPNPLKTLIEPTEIQIGGI